MSFLIVSISDNGDPLPSFESGGGKIMEPRFSTSLPSSPPSAEDDVVTLLVLFDNLPANKTHALPLRVGSTNAVMPNDFDSGSNYPTLLGSMRGGIFFALATLKQPGSIFVLRVRKCIRRGICLKSITHD